jgi:hypothetical protein
VPKSRANGSDSAVGRHYLPPDHFSRSISTEPFTCTSIQGEGYHESTRRL